MSFLLWYNLGKIVEGRGKSTPVFLGVPTNHDKVAEARREEEERKGAKGTSPPLQRETLKRPQGRENLEEEEEGSGRIPF